MCDFQWETLFFGLLFFLDQDPSVLSPYFTYTQSSVQWTSDWEFLSMSGYWGCLLACSLHPESLSSSQIPSTRVINLFHQNVISVSFFCCFWMSWQLSWWWQYVDVTCWWIAERINKRVGKVSLLREEKSSVMKMRQDQFHKTRGGACLAIFCGWIMAARGQEVMNIWS